jgi:uncharacterized membrane protein HdeD (DUF308 family)
VTQQTVTEQRPPWTVQLPLVVVFVAGVAAIALGARTRGADIAFQGLAQMIVGAALCALTIGAKNGSRDSRTILVIVLTGAAVLTTFLRDISSATRWTTLGVAALVIAMLTFPLPSRLFFGDAGAQPAEGDAEDLGE